MLDESANDTAAGPPDGLDERFCEVMDTAPVMIWVSGVNKDCVWFNRLWLNFTGRTMLQELGNGWTEGVHPDDYERCLATYVGHFDALTEFRMQYRLRCQDGGYRWIDDTGIPRYARDGTFLGYIGSCVDVTPLKTLERRAAELTERMINVQEEERQRIAQELHDSTVQHLVAASLHLSSLRPKVSLGSEAANRWDTIEASLIEAQKEIRAFSYLMHPPSLEADGLSASMQEFISGFSERAGIDINIRLNPKLDRLSFQMQRTLLRIAQEALVNVHRHAKAARVWIDGRIIAGRVHLIISDDGRGLADGQKVPLGRGLRGMQDRSSRWGGELRIRSGNKGTQIHATWPVPQAQD
jgi:PAS domain S-box-containing protein